MHSFPTHGTLSSCHSLQCARCEVYPIWTRVWASLRCFPSLLQLVSSRACPSLLLTLGVSGWRGRTTQGTLCSGGGPSLRGEGLFPWLASAKLSAQQAFSVSARWSRKRAKRPVCSIPRGFNGPESDLGCFYQKRPAEILALWHVRADGNGLWKDFLRAPERAAAEKMQRSRVFPVWRGERWKRFKVRPSRSKQRGREPVFHLWLHPQALRRMGWTSMDTYPMGRIYLFPWGFEKSKPDRS